MNPKSNVPSESLNIICTIICANLDVTSQNVNTLKSFCDIQTFQATYLETNTNTGSKPNQTSHDTGPKPGISIILNQIYMNRQ